jgi:hypothetical protein
MTGRLQCIGKESNSLENVDEGMVHSEQSVYTEYADPKRSEWVNQDSACSEETKTSSFD